MEAPLYVYGFRDNRERENILCKAAVKLYYFNDNTGAKRNYLVLWILANSVPRDFRDSHFFVKAYQTFRMKITNAV